MIKYDSNKQSIESVISKAKNSEEIHFSQYQMIMESFNNNQKKFYILLRKYEKISTNNFFTYSPDFDQSNFSNLLISLLNPSTNFDVLITIINIIINLVHYQSENRFLISLLHLNLIEKINFLLENPINDFIILNLFDILSNIANSTPEICDFMLNSINLSLFANPKLIELASPNKIFKLFSSFLIFPLSNEILDSILCVIFPTIYDSIRYDDIPSFITFLYHIKTIFCNPQYFEQYICHNNVISNMILYLSSSGTIPHQTKFMIFSIISVLIDMSPNDFKPMTEYVLNFMKFQYKSEISFVKPISVLMLQLFDKHREMFSGDEFEHIIYSLLECRDNFDCELKSRILIITSNGMHCLSSDFLHSNRNLLYDVCNETIQIENSIIVTNCIFILIKLHHNEQAYKDGINFRSMFIKENCELLNSLYSTDDQKVKIFVTKLLAQNEKEQ